MSAKLENFTNRADMQHAQLEQRQQNDEQLIERLIDEHSMFI